MSIAIRVDNLGKRYRLGLTHAKSIRDLVNRSWKRLLRRKDKLLPHEQNDLQSLAGRPVEEDGSFWALRDVGFEVQPGEVVGVIGRNGSGKSTLLKILSHITAPTTGRVELHGRVASLLEVGTGFHPELTGRENVFLNGAILGMTKAEIRRKFDEIVAFAEIEQFIDTPVKRYSSGMYVRLAFAVAAHLEPEILIVDEVLAVGDVGFQNKCLGKMGEVATTGKTVLVVSHNMAAISGLCTRVVVLEGGNVKHNGNVKRGIETLLSLDEAKIPGTVDVQRHSNRLGIRPGYIRQINLKDRDGRLTSVFHTGQPLIAEIAFAPDASFKQLQFGIGFDDSLGARIFSVTSLFTNPPLVSVLSPSKVICRIDELPLAPGRYLLSISVFSRVHGYIDTVEQAVSIDVMPTDYYGGGVLPDAEYGAVVVRSKWDAEYDESLTQSK